MSRRRYYRSRHNNNKELGCLIEMFLAPIALILALMTSNDPAKKSLGLGLGISLALIVILGSAGVSGEVIIVILGALIGLFIFCVCKKSTPPQIDNKEEATQWEKSVVKEPEKVTKYVHPKNKETSNEVQKALKGGLLSKDTIYDESLVLISTNGRYVNEVISGKDKNQLPLVHEKNETVAIKEDRVKHSIPIRNKSPHIFYSSVEDAVNKNHVPKNYCKIMIEQIRNTNVKECPGISWKDSERFYILPLIVDYPIYSWPIEQLFDIERLKIENVNSDQSYLDFIDQPIADEYEELMPEYFMGDIGVDTERYVLSNGVEVTYASGKVLKEMLCL